MRTLCWISWGERAIFRAALAYELPILFLWIGNRALAWRYGR